MRVTDEHDAAARRLFCLNQTLHIRDYAARLIAAVEVVTGFHETDHHIRYQHHISHRAVSQIYARNMHIL